MGSLSKNTGLIVELIDFDIIHLHFSIVGIGIVVHSDTGGLRYDMAKHLGQDTSNRSELNAAKKALLKAKQMGVSKCILETDSRFLQIIT